MCTTAILTTLRASAFTLTPAQTEDYIIAQATKWDVSVEKALSIARCESGLNPQTIGDKGKSFGMWQIFLPAHPEMTKEKALDLETSTIWAMSEMSKGHYGIWSCYKPRLFARK